MSSSFDPNIPGVGPSAPSIVGDISSVIVTEQPAIGIGNLVIDGDNPFDIEVAWTIEGTLVPLWLTALSIDTKEWVVTAYATPRGPGDGVTLGEVKVPVKANTLPEENPGDPNHSGVYQITVTAFLDSDLGPVGYDMMGYADGPVIKVESPL